MRLTLFDLVLALGFLVLTWFLFFAHGKSGPATPALLASTTLTPGALNANVTQATIGSTICVHGWTGTVRPPSEYTSELKRRQLASFGLRGPPSAYQEDPLISLEL